LLPDCPGVVEDAGGPLGAVAGDAAQAAGLLAHGVCLPDGLALLPLALTPENNHLADQCVPFPLVACSSLLLPGFVAPQEGLAAFDGLPAPGRVGLGPGHGFAGACLEVWHGHAEHPRQVIEPGVPLPGVPFPLVSVPFSLVSDLLALVSDSLALVSDSLTLIGVPLAPVGPLVLRGTWSAVRAVPGGLHLFRMRLSRWPRRGLGLERPAGYAASSG